MAYYKQAPIDSIASAIENLQIVTMAANDSASEQIIVIPRNYLSFLAFSANALNFSEFSTADFFLSSIRRCRDSPNGLLAMAFTAVNGTAENTSTPTSFIIGENNHRETLAVVCRIRVKMSIRDWMVPPAMQPCRLKRS